MEGAAMNSESLIALLHNAALLLAMVAVYDLATCGHRIEGRFWRQALLGVIVGTLGVALIFASYRLEAGIVFDTRSVLLVTCGLFAGPVPTVVAMAITIAFRLAQGGAAAEVGSLVILATGTLGILWRRYRRGPLEDIRWIELYGLGILAHVVMLAILCLLPRDAALRVVAGIGLPVLLIFPVATVALGLLLANRLKRDRATVALAESRERYRSLFEGSHAAMLVVDPGNGAILDANPAACRFYGWSRSELLSKNLLEIDMLTPAGILAEMERARTLGGFHALFRNRVADGTIRDIEVFSGPIVMDGREVLFSIVHDVSERRQAEAERERLLAEAREARQTLLTAMEKRQQAEREKAGVEDQLRQAQKMESVGRLAGGVAHDFNNSLQVVLGYSEQILERPGLSPEMRTDLREIHDAAERSAMLTSHLLAFARRQPIAPRVLDLNEAVAGMLKMLSRLIGENINLKWAPGPGLSLVHLDPGQIDQIMMNLCVNARDAIQGAGIVELWTQNASLDAEFCAAHEGATPGPYVLLAVKDNGCGMDRDIRERIFEPFFTTKGVGQGTGLGLATVYGIVRQNDGLIDVESEPGKGTVFRVYFPSHAEPSSGPSPEPASGVVAGEGDAVLLVEDDASVLSIVKALLEGAGFFVLCAQSPAEALRQVRAFPRRIRLLISDIVMPEMNGREMADILRVSMPGMPCLFMSGYSAEAITRGGVLDHGVFFIEKPFTRASFHAKLREVLAAAGTTEGRGNVAAGQETSGE